VDGTYDERAVMDAMQVILDAGLAGMTLGDTGGVIIVFTAEQLAAGGWKIHGGQLVNSRPITIGPEQLVGQVWAVGT
jgi:hypothetical protein